MVRRADPTRSGTIRCALVLSLDVSNGFMLDHFEQFVFLVNDNNPRAVVVYFIGVGMDEAHDDHAMPDLGEAGSCAVYANDAAPGIAGNDVRLEAIGIFAIGDDD